MVVIFFVATSIFQTRMPAGCAPSGGNSEVCNVGSVAPHSTFLLNVFVPTSAPNDLAGGRTITGTVGVTASGAIAAGAADTTKSNDSRRAAATAQFDRAEEQRSALNEKPANKRTLAEYKSVVTTYRRVFLITPRAPEVP